MPNLARSMGLSTLVLAGVIAHTSPARADDSCDNLRARLTLEHHRVQVWRYGWAIAFGTAAIAQGALAPAVSDKQQRDTLYNGAIKAGIGAIARLILPVRAELPAETATCAEWRAALVTVGNNERAGFWLNHLGGLAVNIGGAIILAHYTNWKVGAVSFAIGYPVGTISTYTQPRWAWHPIFADDNKPVGVGVTTAF